MLCRGPNGPFESPAHFFRVSLEQNILTSVDLHCLQACVAAAKQLDGSHRIHVNLYPSTMLATPTSRLIEMFANGPHRFVLELSEQQFLGDTSLLRPHVMALRKAGIKVAVDDVGFGRSSLEALLHLEPDVVKIDRSCVSGVSNDPHKARLLSRLVRVVGALGAEMVAEGIEDRDDLVLLQSFEIDYGQGYLWGRPA